MIIIDHANLCTFPDKAIKAAALAMAQIETGDDGVTVANEIDLILARAALEAAAPYMVTSRETIKEFDRRMRREHPEEYKKALREYMSKR